MVRTYERWAGASALLFMVGILAIIPAVLFLSDEYWWTVLLAQIPAITCLFIARKLESKHRYEVENARNWQI